MYVYNITSIILEKRFLYHLSACFLFCKIKTFSFKLGLISSLMFFITFYSVSPISGGLLVELLATSEVAKVQASPAPVTTGNL